VKDALLLVTESLQRFYTASEAERWLTAPHQMLNGERAMDMIDTGRTDEVLKVIERLEDGVFL
jgi:uncharacterized protein (DUF2384 family)